MRSLRGHVLVATCVVAAAGVGLGVISLDAGGAGKAIACGDMITASVKLTADLSCTGDALLVAGDKVKVDLQGHTIAGDGDAADVGVKILSLAEGVTVTNGTITDFGNGVRIDQNGGHTVSKLTVRSTTADAILLAFTAASKVSGNTIVDTDGNGIRLDHAGPGSAISGNSVVDAVGAGISVDGDDAGITKNAVSYASTAISVEGVGAVVSGNQVAQGGFGISVFGDHATVKDNAVDSTSAYGIAASGPGDVLVSGNRIGGAGNYGVVIQVSGSAQVNKNVVTGGDSGGIWFVSGSGGVSGNTTNGNSLSGLTICVPGVTYSKNTARLNRAEGISRHAGAIDGGGNAVSGNLFDGTHVGDCF